MLPSFLSLLLLAPFCSIFIDVNHCNSTSLHALVSLCCILIWKVVIYDTSLLSHLSHSSFMITPACVGPRVNMLWLIRIRPVSHIHPSRTWSNRETETENGLPSQSDPSSSSPNLFAPWIQIQKWFCTQIDKCTHIVAKTRRPLDLFVSMSLLLFIFFFFLLPFAAMPPLKSSIHLLWKWMCHPHLSHRNYANDRQH